jgi:hypothetical protein
VPIVFSFDGLDVLLISSQHSQRLMSLAVGRICQWKLSEKQNAFHGNSSEKGEETFATAFCLTNDCENDKHVAREALKGDSAPKVKSGNDPDGAWCGLAKPDDDGGVKKAVRTSCAVIANFGEQTRALSCFWVSSKSK